MVSNSSCRSQFNLANSRITTVVAAVAAALAAAHVAVAQTPFPTNDKPENQIRFKTPAEADARRDKLVKFIWKDGLPTTVPKLSANVPLPAEAVGVNPSNVANVDRLEIDISGWDFHAFAYLLHPKNTANEKRVVLVHQGHAGTLMAGVGTTANHLLQNGYTVAIMEMPLYGWNTDKTAKIPGRGTLTYKDHDDIIFKTAENDDGQGFRPFLEPIVQTINYIVASVPGLKEVDMVGLSGGGWTTSVAAAIDPRIKLSMPVAGSAPLYHRNVDPSSVGDPEQYYLPLYREDIAADGSGGGVATWLEIYALGGYGADRRQILVGNQFDTCCFPGTFYDSYKTIVADRVKQLGEGQWEHFLDSTHKSHQISKHVIAKVVDPLFGIDHPAPTPSGLPIHDEFDKSPGAVPQGWAADSQNGAGFTAIENAGHVTLSGPGLASIVRSVPFNPQAGHSITISMQLANMSKDNFGGIFITDEIGSRPHQLGVLLNASTGEVALNADNGDGFDMASDRLKLGTLADYEGGPAKITFTFDAEGFSATIDAGKTSKFDSGNIAWSHVHGGFDPANLGDQAYLFLQSFDLDGAAPASMVVDSVLVESKK